MMRTRGRRALGAGAALFALTLSPGLTQAQPAAPGPRLAPVTAFPTPGTYANTTGITLLDADPEAEIHYSWDGSRPTAASPKLEPGQRLFITGVYDGDRGLTTGYTIRAVALRAGHADSDPVTLSYTVARRDRTAYVSEIVAPGVRMIRDSDNDKMFVVSGDKAFALIDSGMGRGPLRDYVAQFTGGRPVIPIFTHSHGDHIGQANEFIAASTEFVGAGDRQATAQFLRRQGVDDAVIAAHLKPVSEGDVIDLGGRRLEIHAVAGHTPGSIVIFDRANGLLFTGDSVGNNSPLPPDVMWMQFADRSLDVLLANVRTMRAHLGGRVKKIMTGHNDRPLEGERYLDNVEKALQRGLDQGERALIPSWRPPGLSQLVEGDLRSDPDWFGVNVNRRNFLPAPPDQIAGLTGLVLTGARLDAPLDPAVHDYTATRDRAGGAVTIAATPTSSRSRALTIAGRAAQPGRPAPWPAHARRVEIKVTAPDGAATAIYRISLTGAR